jgi:hypothetical protein
MVCRLFRKSMQRQIPLRRSMIGVTWSWLALCLNAEFISARRTSLNGVTLSVRLHEGGKWGRR